jgi:hypothetical protein
MACVQLLMMVLTHHMGHDKLVQQHMESMLVHDKLGELVNYG